MPDFMCFRVRLGGSDLRERSDRLIAETWHAGASGHEERSDPEAEREPSPSERSGPLLVIYAPREAAERVWRAAQQVMEQGDEASPLEAVEAVDWTRAWSQGLQAIEISRRLVVRPSSVAWHSRADHRRESNHESDSWNPIQRLDHGNHDTG